MVCCGHEARTHITAVAFQQDGPLLVRLLRLPATAAWCPLPLLALPLPPCLPTGGVAV